MGAAELPMGLLAGVKAADGFDSVGCEPEPEADDEGVDGEEG